MNDSLLTKIGKDVIKYNVKPYLSDCEYITNNGERCKNPYMAKFKDLQTGEVKECNMYCLKNSTPEMFRSMFTIPYMLTNTNVNYRPTIIDYKIYLYSSKYRIEEELHVFYRDGKYHMDDGKNDIYGKYYVKGKRKNFDIYIVLNAVSNIYRKAKLNNFKTELNVYINTAREGSMIVGFKTPFIRPLSDWKIERGAAYLKYVS